MREKAIRRCLETNKKLLLCVRQDHADDFIGTEDYNNKYGGKLVTEIARGMKSVENLRSKNLDQVILERDVFEEADNSAQLQLLLGSTPPADMFLCHRQFYSVSYWLSKTKRIFVFHPPDYRFVYAIENPFFPYIGHIYGFGAILTVYILVSS